MPVISNISDLHAKSVFVQLHSPFAERSKREDGTDGEYITPITAEFLYTGSDGKPLGFRIVGFESERMRQGVLRQKRAVMHATPQDLADPMYLIKTNIELLSSAVVGWSHDEVFGEYSPARALEVLLDGDFAWALNQLETAIANRKSFLPA